MSLHDSDHLSGYCIPSLIRLFGQFYSKVCKGILDGVGWLLNKLYQPILIGGRRIQTVHGVDAHIKSFGSLELGMNISSSCLLCCYIFRLTHCSPICSHLSTLIRFSSGEVDPRCLIRVTPGVGVLICQFYLLPLKYHHSFSLHLLKR